MYNIRKYRWDQLKNEKKQLIPRTASLHGPVAGRRRPASFPGPDLWRRNGPENGQARLFYRRQGIVIRSPADFAGLKLITRRAGPGDALFLREFLRQEGVPETSVTIMDQVDDDQQRPLLREGKVDGGYLHLITIANLIKIKKVYVYRPMNWLNPEISLAVLAFRKDFLSKHRDLVVKIVSAYTKRIGYERTIPEAKLEKTRKHGRTGMMKLDVHGMSLPVYDYPPKVRVELLKEMEHVMILHGLLEGTTDIGLFVDNSAVEAVWKDLNPAEVHQ